MKFRHLGLALLLLGSCARGVQESKTRVEAAATRAETAAAQAERASEEASAAWTRASKAAGEAESDVRRANDAVSRFEVPHLPQCDLLQKPTRGSMKGWCLMVSQCVGQIGRLSLGLRHDRDIASRKSSIRRATVMIRSARFAALLKERREYNADHPQEKWPTIRLFCAPCANDGDNDED
jgi:hypothetical protein